MVSGILYKSPVPSAVPELSLTLALLGSRNTAQQPSPTSLATKTSSPPSTSSLTQTVSLTFSFTVPPVQEKPLPSLPSPAESMAPTT